MYHIECKTILIHIFYLCYFTANRRHQRRPLPPLQKSESICEGGLRVEINAVQQGLEWELGLQLQGKEVCPWILIGMGEN